MASWSPFSTPSPMTVISQRMSRGDHGGDDLLLTVAPADVLNETAVDFQRVRAELLQVAEGGITGPEIIEPDADSGSRQHRERFPRVAGSQPIPKKGQAPGVSLTPSPGTPAPPAFPSPPDPASGEHSTT